MVARRPCTPLERCLLGTAFFDTYCTCTCKATIQPHVLKTPHLVSFLRKEGIQFLVRQRTVPLIQLLLPAPRLHLLWRHGANLPGAGRGQSHCHGTWTCTKDIIRQRLHVHVLYVYMYTVCCTCVHCTCMYMYMYKRMYMYMYKCMLYY